MLSIVVLAIASETGLGISVWGFIVSVHGGSLMGALAAVILFVAAVIGMLLSYLLVHQRAWSGGNRDRCANRRVLTLKPGQSMAFRLIPGEDSYVTVRPEPDQWATTRIDPVHEGMRTNGHG